MSDTFAYQGARKKLVSMLHIATSLKNKPSNNAQSYYVKTVKSKSEPDPMDYSKWYWIQSKGKLEIGISLGQVTGWINRLSESIKTIKYAAS